MEHLFSHVKIYRNIRVNLWCGKWAVSFIMVLYRVVRGQRKMLSLELWFNVKDKYGKRKTSVCEESRAYDYGWLKPLMTARKRLMIDFQKE